MVTHDQGLGVTTEQVFEQSAHSSLLFIGTRVGGLTADVEPALVADAYRVGIVVQAVGTDEILRTARFDRSVTTDDVVVADAEVETPLAVPSSTTSSTTSTPRWPTTARRPSNMAPMRS